MNLEPIRKNDKFVKIYSLALVVDEVENKILLGYKKRGFGMGKWNGFGGKLKENETISECCKRELLEECSLVANEVEKFAIVVFEFINNPIVMETHFFKIINFSGNIEESDEMMPKWFDIKNIPFEKMWADDKIWYSLFLENQNFNGYFLFEKENILYKELNILEKGEKIIPLYCPTKK